MQIDRIIRSKRKTVALIVETDGSLSVRAPLKLSHSAIESIVAKKTGWIEQQRQRQKTAALAHPPRRYVTGEEFWFLGSLIRLQVVSAPASPARAALWLDEQFYLIETARPRARQLFAGWYRRQALRILPPRVAHFAPGFGHTTPLLRITSARARWGSCSPNNTLNFPWRLVMAPIEVIDYVVVHELAHIREKNHGPRFWALVEAALPDFHARRAWLKQHNPSLD